MIWGYHYFRKTSKCRVGRRSFPFGFRTGGTRVLVFREGIEHPNGLRTSEWLRAKIWAICFQLVPDFFSFKDTPGFLFLFYWKSQQTLAAFFQPRATPNFKKHNENSNISLPKCVPPAPPWNWTCRYPKWCQTWRRKNTCFQPSFFVSIRYLGG